MSCDILNLACYKRKGKTDDFYCMMFYSYSNYCTIDISIPRTHNACFHAISFCTLTLRSLSPQRKRVLQITRWWRLRGRLLLLYTASAQSSTATVRYTGMCYVLHDHMTAMHECTAKSYRTKLWRFRFFKFRFMRYFCGEHMNIGTE